MRKNFVVALAGLGLIAAIGAAPAQAQYTSTQCSSNAFYVCAAVSVSNGTASNQLTLNFWNLFGASYPVTGSGYSSVVTFIGLGFLDAFTGHVTGLSNAPTGWKLTKNNINNNPVGLQLDTAALTNGVNYGVVGQGSTKGTHQYQTVWGGSYGDPSPFAVTFQFDGTVSSSDVATWGIHAQAVNNGTCSLWLAGDGTTVGDAGTGCGTTVTPEPVTILLLGTGLASMGGVGLVRRRKKNGDIENA